MKNNSKDELKRFIKIFISTSLDKVKFAELFELTPTMINNYLKGKADLQKISRRIVQLGFSSDWLYLGKGKMHNDFVEILDPALENEVSIDEMNKRVNTWINKSFISVDEFEVETSVEYSMISDAIANSKLLPYSIIKKLKTSGMNYEWSITGKGQMFENNKNGKKFKHRHFTNQIGLK